MWLDAVGMKISTSDSDLDADAIHRVQYRPRPPVAAGLDLAAEQTRMAELSVSETTTFRWPFEEDVSQYPAAGIPAIGVWRHKLSDCGLPKALDLLGRSGLKVSHLSWAGGFTGSDGRSLRESVEDGLEAVRTATG